MTKPLSETSLDRRRFLIASGAGGAALLATQMFPVAASADMAKLQAAMKKAFGDKNPKMGRVSIDAPEIAENGRTVPIGIDVKSAMKGNDMVKAVHIWADGNPNPDVVTFRYSAISGSAKASTRMRMAKTQNLYAVAEMANGELFMAKRLVKVTIGGCGG